MAAVGSDLRVHLGTHHGAAFTPPSPGTRVIGKERADRMQGYGFSKQVRVGGKINGEISLQMAAMRVQGIEQAAACARAHPLSCDVIDPDPGECAESYFQRAGPI